MADQGGQFDWKHLLGILSSSFAADPGNLNQWRREEGWGDSVVEDMFGRSQAIDKVRQQLPESVGDTGAGKWLGSQLPKSTPEDSLQSKVVKAVQNLPVGGYSDEYKQALARKRLEDEALRIGTVERGQVPNRRNTADVDVGDRLRAATAQNVGVVASDIATDGLRNLWWFLNAPQAIASVAMLQAVHGGGVDSKPVGQRGPLLKSRGLRLAAAVPAVIATSYGIGNATRLPGYTAAVPSETDKTVTADPLAEAGSRYFLGRTGSLLPYDEFVKERPDVSKGEYEAYKAYLFGSASPVKATLDGIHGPEVNFMGKSIPLATGVLPAVAAVLGARHGVNKAAARLKREGNRLEQANRLEGRISDARQQFGAGSAEENRAKGAYQRRNRSNEMQILGQSLLYSGGAATAASIAGQTLESIRRTLKGPAPAEPEELV